MVLARYMVWQFIPPFLFGLSLFSGVLLLDKIFDLIDLLVNKGVALGLSAKIFALFLPTVMSLSVPMSILLACLLTFGRLSEDNEILALRASGLSFRQILWPPLAFAVLVSAVLVPFNTNLTPRAMERFRSLFHQIATTDPLLQIEPKRFISVQNMRLYATNVSKDKKSLEGVWIYRHFPDHIQRVFAHRGQAAVDSRQLTLTLEDGQIERYHHGPEGEFLHIAFKDYRLRIPFQGGANARDKSWREYTIQGLRTEIARRKSLRLPFSELEAEFHLRFALGFAPLALALIGIPLGMTLERGGRGVGFGAAIGVLFFYYLLLVMGLNLAERGSWPAGPALWAANGAAALVGLFLYKGRVAA